MKLLLIVGCSNDIFIYNYAKWLKRTTEVSIDIFEFYPSSQQGYGKEYYDNVETAKGFFLPFNRGKDLFDGIARGRDLNKFIKNKYYDVIHCHWIVAPVVIQRNLKKHCMKLFLTFWGGELIEQRILRSNSLYRYYLRRFSKQVDCIVNTKNGKEKILSQVPYYNGEYRCATLGSAPLEVLYDLMKKESKTESKRAIGISSEKTTVLIGYSGKELHQHLPIIASLSQYNELRNRIHILAPMTRGASDHYIDKVRQALNCSKFDFTLLSKRFLSDKEIARLRNATDIVLQMSTFDGFSRSIIECLCAKSIVIYGDWLGYEYYMDSSGFTGFEVSSIEDGIKELSEIVENTNIYIPILEKNHENGRHHALWSECIKDWVNAYNDFL